MSQAEPYDDELEESDRELMERVDALLAPRAVPKTPRRRVEQIDGPTVRQQQAAQPSWFVPPPWGWQRPVPGPYGWLIDPSLLAFGQYLKRARYLARKTQRSLSAEAGVDQGLISRLERGKAPWARVDRLVLLSDALGRYLPLGYCPHEHGCKWQPAPKAPPEPPEDRMSPAMREVAAERARREREGAI